MDASEIYSKRLNAKEVIFPKKMENFKVADGRIKLPGGDQDMRTSTSIRDRPTREESHVYFLEKSKGSPPPLQDSLPEAGEAINDCWSMSGNFIYRHLSLLHKARNLQKDWKKNLHTRIYVVRREINEKTADIQARLFMARTLGENGKECQAEGEAKVVT